jgi:hypothetical protein
MSKTNTDAGVISAADKAMLDQVEADLAAGKDPFGDLDEDDDVGTEGEGEGTGGDEAAQDSADAEADAAAQAEKDAAAAQAAADVEQVSKDADGAKDDDQTQAAQFTAEQLAAVAGDPVPTSSAPQFRVEAPQDFDAKIAAAEAKDAAALKELMEGAIDADAYAAIRSETSKEIRSLERQQARADTLAEANAQQAEHEQTRALNQVKAHAKAAGLDYDADTKAQSQFNAALQVLAADPDNATKGAAEIYALANQSVMAIRGLLTAKQATTTPVVPAVLRKAKDAPPITLRDVPSAAAANTGGGLNEQLSRLKGQDFEAAFDKLSPAQRAALLED